MNANNDKRPDLSMLTPMQAQRIVEHFIRQVNPAIAEAEHADIHVESSWLGPIAIGRVRSNPNPVEPIAYGYHSHFVEGFVGGSSELASVAKGLGFYAAATHGRVDLTARDLDMFSTLFGMAWDIIDRAKTSGSAHVRNQATELEQAIIDTLPMRTGKKTHADSVTRDKGIGAGRY